MPIAAAVPGRYLGECAIAVRGLARRCEEAGRGLDTEPLLAEAGALMQRCLAKEEDGGEAGG